VNSKVAREKLLASVRNLVRKVLASFRGTEADACALLAAYGFYAFELDRLQDNRSVERKASSPKSVGSTHSKWNGWSIGPIPIGVHPDLAEASRRNTPRKHGCFSVASSTPRPAGKPRCVRP
jgi:hypothetical protein